MSYEVSSTGCSKVLGIDQAKLNAAKIGHAKHFSIQ